MIWRVLFAPGPSSLSGPSDVTWLPLSGFCFVGLGCLLLLSFSLSSSLFIRWVWLLWSGKVFGWEEWSRTGRKPLPRPRTAAF